MKRRNWEFHFDPLQTYDWKPSSTATAWVLATTRSMDPALARLAFSCLATSVHVEPIVEIHPLYWYFVELDVHVTAVDLSAKLDSLGVPVRYVSPARHGSHQLGKPADFSDAPAHVASSWPDRPRRRDVQDAQTPGRWFLDASGVAIDRAVCGSGAGTRLAVVDNDAGGTHQLELDAEVGVGIEELPRGSLHAAMMVGWAVGATRPDGSGFTSGAAPDASVRLYCIPKPGAEVFNLPAAIVRAVADGADVVLCSTYVDGLSSPMLDDALAFARRLGRSGKGSAVVMPTSREMSSAEGSSHASLSLGMSEPASDPRVFCIGPSARDGRWFLWRDKRGKLHPFANRGPALRWLAPGDDMALPLAQPERISHAESSGAASIAAGVVLLVLEANPELTVDDVDRLLTNTATGIDAAGQQSLPDLADPHDLNPIGVDRDGHNAKHGYGRINASLACAAARDPFAASFIGIGEHELGLAIARGGAGGGSSILSKSLSTWLARELLAGGGLVHAFSAIARAVRLRSTSSREHAPGSLLRQWLIALREYALPNARSRQIERELLALDAELHGILCDPREALGIEKAALAWLSPSASGSPTLGQIPRTCHGILKPQRASVQR